MTPFRALFERVLIELELELDLQPGHLVKPVSQIRCAGYMTVLRTKDDPPLPLGTKDCLLNLQNQRRKPI